MSLFFEIDETLQVDNLLDYQKQAQYVIDGVLDFLKCPYECEVSLLLTDDIHIQEVNKEQRNLDKSTDVLSFPMVEWEVVGDLENLEDDIINFHPESGELMLGDIVISYETMMKQASEYGHSVKREFSFLIVHSVLHLFGHDHMEEEERVAMECLQNNIMDVLDILR